MNCQYATPISHNANSCGLKLYGGTPSSGVCAGCIARKQNNPEFAASYKPPSPSSTTPTLPQMARSLASSAARWAKSGFQTTTPEQLESRLAICQSCEFWEEAGFAGTGKCKKCGCSTQAKLRMATSKCPIDKWGPVDVVKTD